MELDVYINELEIKENMIKSAIALARDAPNIKDLYVVCESIKGLDGLDGLKEEALSRLVILGKNTSKDDLVFSNKIISCFESIVPSDMDYLNIKSQVIIGNRKLEDLENKIMEEYYV